MSGRPGSTNGDEAQPCRAELIGYRIDASDPPSERWPEWGCVELVTLAVCDLPTGHPPPHAGVAIGTDERIAW